MLFRPGGGVFRYATLVAVCILSLLHGGAGAAEPDPSFASHMRVQLQRLIHLHRPRTDGRDLQHVATIRRAYDALDYQALWTDRHGWLPKADFLLEYIDSAYQHGLDASRYHRDNLSRLQAGHTLAERIHSELLLSDAFLGLLQDLTPDKDARADTRTLQLLLRIKPVDDPTRILDAVLPDDREYWALTRALKRLLSEADTAAPAFPLETTLRPGDTAPDVYRLSALLRQSGDFSGPISELFTPELAAALEKFQRRHGLEADRIAGPATRRQLNAGYLERIEQIVLNLERRRRQAQPLRDNEIRINVAAQELTYRYQGLSILTMKVIAGRPERPTPVTTGSIDRIVLNPDWTVPYRIAVKDKLPQIRQDPGYLLRNGFTVQAGWSANAEFLDPLNIDWTRVEEDNFPYVLRQLPGDNNALGQVKFLFPNEYSVYLHDTPAKHLFQRSQRLFSSGCIRLAEPMQLAELMLRHHAPESAVSLPVDDSATREIRLDEPVPVILEYWTAWVSDDGELQFRPDIYARDRRLLTELAASGRRPQASRLMVQMQHSRRIQLAGSPLDSRRPAGALASP